MSVPTARDKGSLITTTTAETTPAAVNAAAAAAWPNPASVATKVPKRKVVELECAQVRWFRKRTDDNKWIPFKGALICNFLFYFMPEVSGYDSMALEIAYRELYGIPLDVKAQQQRDDFPRSETVVVMDNLFEWNASDGANHIQSIYWKNEKLDVRRGTWFFLDTVRRAAN